MTLVDTSVWIDHGVHQDDTLVALLNFGRVYSHPFVAGELAVGSFKQRQHFLALHEDLPQAVLVEPNEVLEFIRVNQLHGRGIGYIDAHLLASVRVLHGTELWTRDKRLIQAARKLGIPVVTEYAN